MDDILDVYKARKSTANRIVNIIDSFGPLTGEDSRALYQQLVDMCAQAYMEGLTDSFRSLKKEL